MENKDFNKYLLDIKSIINSSGNNFTPISRLIKAVQLNHRTVDNNKEYFLDCFNSNMSPDDAILSLKYNEEDLLRNIGDFSDDVIIQEVKNRYISNEFVGDIDTNTLEEELESRWDKTSINYPNEVTLSDFISDYTLSEVICAALGLSNTFAYTKEEIIEELKKKL